MNLYTHQITITSNFVAIDYLLGNLSQYLYFHPAVTKWYIVNIYISAYFNFREFAYFPLYVLRSSGTKVTFDRVTQLISQKINSGRWVKKNTLCWEVAYTFNQYR